MVAIVKELTIAADPERVWNALTQSEEIGHWWTNDLQASHKIAFRLYEPNGESFPNYVSFSPQKGELEEKDASHV